MNRPLLPTLAFALSALAVPAQDDGNVKKLEREFEAAKSDYLDQLGDVLPVAYQEHLANLSRKQMGEVADVRRLWQWYISEGPFTMGDPRKQSTGIFRREFLDPMEKVAETLLLDPSQLPDADLQKARAKAFKLAVQLQRAREHAGIDVDPTATKQAPTGIPYPRLDNPHTCSDVLELYERTLVLAKTVAHPDAEAALMKNAEACAEIDLLEADFVMYANQMRMLSGSIAWVCDPLMTACSRDHSHDRKNGDASGHQSKLPGKKFPGDRARRFGCRSGPEGAGGGGTGRQALRGFSYNGTGHGGPLYAMLRNVVGPGNRQGAMTAMYQTDNALKHDCAATENEMVLPPGVTARMIKSGNVRSAFTALSRGDFQKAAALLDNRKPEDTFQRAIHHYLEARLQAEVDWRLTGIERIMGAGDVFEAAFRLKVALDDLEGIGDFDKRAKRLKAKLTKGAVAREVKIGELYQKIVCAKKVDPKRVQAFIEEHPRSVYAKAAQHYLEAGKDAFWPQLFYFVMQDTHLNKWSYLTKERLGEF